MKKKLLIALFFLTAFSLQAQVTVKPGVRAGVNFSRLTDTDLDSKTDFYVGGFAAVKLSRFYTLQPEITYSRQGGEGDVTNFDYNLQQDVTRHYNVELNYVSLAALNKFTFSDSFNVHVGPFFDILATGSHYDGTDVDLGITGGIGYTMPFGLTVEARVKAGIVDVVDSYLYVNDYNDTDYFDGYGHNLVFSVGLSYSFDVKGTTK